MTKFYCFLLLASIALFSGCATPSARVFEDYPARSDYEAVEIIYDVPIRPYVTIAEIEMTGASEKTIMKKGASYGADAVYVASYGAVTSYTRPELRNSDKDSTIRSNREYICTVIKYK